MGGKKLVCGLACLLVIVLPWLTVSCAKKVVQMEEAVVPEAVEAPEEALPVEVPEGAPEEAAAVGEPSEVALSEEEAFRRETFTFTDEDIHFDFDRYDLKPRAREMLAQKAYFLKKYPSVKILIEGHCDERGTNEYNLALGERRANSARQYLINLGISEDRIATISYGEERPLDSGHDEAAWAKNRRAHFEIVSS